MSGHSKWSKVKHQKATTDAVKASAFTKASRGISIAVKEGGGITDPEKNYKLRPAIEKAKDANMPKDNIERAIARAGQKGEEEIKEAIYEAMGPGSVAILIKTATDNTNRTISTVKNVLERHHGTLVAKGAVGHLFTLTGVIVINRGSVIFDDLFADAVENGADDVVEAGEYYEIYVSPDKLVVMKQRLESRFGSVDNTEVVYRPLVTVSISMENQEQLIDLKDHLEEAEDVQQVFTNEVLEIR